MADDFSLSCSNKYKYVFVYCRLKKNLKKFLINWLDFLVSLYPVFCP